MAQIELITVDPNICHGQACIKGTRIPASVILDCFAAGMTPAEITGQYPSVDAAGIRAASGEGRDPAFARVCRLKVCLRVQTHAISRPAPQR